MNERTYNQHIFLISYYCYCYFHHMDPSPRSFLYEPLYPGHPRHRRRHSHYWTDDEDDNGGDNEVHNKDDNTDNDPLVQVAVSAEVSA